MDFTKLQCLINCTRCAGVKAHSCSRCAANGTPSLNCHTSGECWKQSLKQGEVTERFKKARASLTPVAFSPPTAQPWSDRCLTCINGDSRPHACGMPRCSNHSCQQHWCKYCHRLQRGSSGHLSAGCPQNPRLRTTVMPGGVTTVMPSPATTGCVFACGYCSPGQKHRCRKCGMLNSHRSIDCPSTSQRVPSAPADSKSTSSAKRSLGDNLRTLPRATSSHGLKGSGVLLVCVEGGSTFIALGRRNCGNSTGKMAAPGGHIDRGESPESAAVRETLEETGIRVSKSDLRLVHEKPQAGGYVSYVVMLGRRQPLNPPSTHAWEWQSGTLKWYNLAEVNTMIARKQVYMPTYYAITSLSRYM